MKHIRTFENFLTESLNEDLPDGIIRVFKTKDMKDYIKDVPVDNIKERGKDIKVKNYIVNTVVLKDGTKGWIWSENENFED
jgi:hypothetical protein